MVEKALIQFNNGYTDIINLISIVKYYSNIYSHSILIIREDVKDFLNFFLKNINTVDVVYIKYSDQLKYHNNAWRKNIDLTYTNTELISFCKLKNINIKEYKRKYIGHMDRLLSNKPGTSGPTNSKFNFFSEKLHGNWLKAFYLSNELDYSIRYKYFEIDRDYELENKKYNEFVKKYGDNYNLCHSNNMSDFEKKYNAIELSGKSLIFFDYIKILINSKNMYLTDSAWACFIYLLDMKYNLFKNNNIFYYPLKWKITFFVNEPLLNNWKIIK
tara:strand:- start:509 stop:1324 length:816 start_codon:yes stop_codon:yes gene_type:complete